jgi:heterodisulfide reductase subunit C
MFALSPRPPATPRDYAACTGCSLCFLVCPMWRASRDPRFTPEGLAKALQNGATATDLAAPLDACSLCGACDPVCPEGIDLSGMIMDLRRRLPQRAPQPPLEANAARAELARSAPVLLPGPQLRADAELLARIQALLGLAVFDDDGADITRALELGHVVPEGRLHAFVESLRGYSIVAADGLLLRQLRRWLPGSQRMGLGAALSTRAAVRSNIAATDLYIIEPRAFHGDYERLVGYYDRLQRETGCSLNLDLQRIAIPARSHGLARQLGLAAGEDRTQTRWILQGRRPERILVECLADRAAFEGVCELPVLHLAELGEDPQMMNKFRHAFG